MRKDTRPRSNLRGHGGDTRGSRGATHMKPPNLKGFCKLISIGFNHIVCLLENAPLAMPHMPMGLDVSRAADS